MLASSGRPAGDLGAWAAEPKLDGLRCQVTLDASRPRGGCVRTRPGRDITDRIDVVAGLAGVGVDVVLDGELVAGAGKMSDFYDIAPALARRHRREPLTFVAFDLLAFAGEVIINEPYEVRRRLLDRLVALSDGCLTAVPSWAGNDAELLLDACDSHLIEGMVLKRLNSIYTPGRRSNCWRKVKISGWADHAERRRPR
jgi:bifunctional non-homologous end joining protein LigD